MTDHNPNRPVGSGLPPERDRLGATPPPINRGGPPRDDRGNSAMALIVGALAVALIIGAFFWFAGDTQDTATLDDPATIEETVTTDDPAVTTDDDVVITDEDTTVTEVEPADDASPTVETETTDDTDEVIDETQQGATEEPEAGATVPQTQQN